MKYSKYNVWAEAGDRHWVFNGLSGSMIDLSPADFDAAQALVASGTAPDATAVETVMWSVATELLKR